MINKNIKYSYNDLSIVPAEISTIRHRAEIDVFTDNATLPIFAAPMSSVINELNYTDFEDNFIIPVIPRNIALETRIKLMAQSGQWIALSLSEFHEFFVKENCNIHTNESYRVCIDIANGHMRHMYDEVNIAKEIAKQQHYDLTIMVGNIANPETYRWMCENTNVDYVRCGIGSGSCCTTTSNTSVHYPMASLINECYEISMCYDNAPKIIADGGIRNFSDVIKALALGADYVMIGGLFGGMWESASNFKEDIITDNGSIKICSENNIPGLEAYKTKSLFALGGIWHIPSNEISEEVKRSLVKHMNLHKEIWGMSTKRAQKEISGSANKTAEGIEKLVPVKYTLTQWTDNMKAYLKSAMSYCNADSLNKFIGKPELIINSVQTVCSVNK